jgi:hypothetical protein
MNSPTNSADEAKFSYLVKTDLDKDYPSLRAQYLWPISRMNTNAAYQLAIRWLSQLSIDIHALTNACRTHIIAMMPEGENGLHFVPVYWVYWQRPEEEGQRNAASVELLEPTKTIRQLRVEEPRYMLRKPITITNLGLSAPNPTQTIKGRPNWPSGIVAQHTPLDYAYIGTQLRRYKTAQTNDLSDSYRAKVSHLLLEGE